MQIYFSCDFPSVIKLNGLYLGHIHPTPKHVDVSLSDQTFVEICPLIKEEIPFSFILNNDFLHSPNTNAVVVDLVGGYFLHFRKSAKISGFNVLCQERFNDALITVFTEKRISVVKCFRLLFEIADTAKARAKTITAYDAYSA